MPCGTYTIIISSPLPKEQESQKLEVVNLSTQIQLLTARMDNLVSVVSSHVLHVKNNEAVQEFEPISIIPVRKIANDKYMFSNFYVCY